MTFHKLKYPLKNWKPAHMKVSSIGKGKMKVHKRQTEVFFQTVPGLDFMIGGKDTCNVRKNCFIRAFGEAEAFFRVTVGDLCG